MTRIVPWVAVVRADLQTYKKPVKKDKDHMLTPWGFSKAPEVFNFGERNNSYPYMGIKNLPRHCSDLSEIIKTDSDWAAWRSFLTEFEENYILKPASDESLMNFCQSAVSMSDKSKGKKAAKTSKKTVEVDVKHAHGATLVMRWWALVWKRANQQANFDRIAAKVNMLPHHINFKAGERSPYLEVRP